MELWKQNFYDPEPSPKTAKSPRRSPKKPRPPPKKASNPHPRARCVWDGRDPFWVVLPHPGPQNASAEGSPEQQPEGYPPVQFPLGGGPTPTVGRFLQVLVRLLHFWRFGPNCPALSVRLGPTLQWTAPSVMHTDRNAIRTPPPVVSGLQTRLPKDLPFPPAGKQAPCRLLCRTPATPWVLREEGAA